MESLVIHAVSLESAEGFCHELEEFGAKLIEADGGRYKVEIPLGGSNRAIVNLLNALEAYVSRRADGPARVELDGRGYQLRPVP